MNTSARCASRERERLSFDKQFYSEFASGKRKGTIYGFPMRPGAWCNSRLKVHPLHAYLRTNLLYNSEKEVSREIPAGDNQRIPDATETLVQQQTQDGLFDNRNFPNSSIARGANINTVHYVGIAADEPERLKRLDGVTTLSPLHTIGWTKADAYSWCEENNLLSPIYTTATRGGCWFCHNQGVDQLRRLRKNYPDLWALLMKWDSDSPMSFHSDGRTVRDFDLRFQLEEEGKIPSDRTFRWNMIQTK